MQYRYDAKYPSRRSPVFARNIVSSSQSLATQAGLAVLAKGGNAVDAAIATAATLTVVEPTGNGLGSDAFCIVFDGKELHGLNASGRSPRAWSPARFQGRNEIPKRGWESVTVPGAVSAWHDLWNRFGRLPFATLLEPAVKYAETGFTVTPVIGELWRRGAEELKAQPGFAEAFMPNGVPPRAGELFRNLPLARSLTLIAETTGKAFYRGELAERIAWHARQSGAALTEQDLAEHRNDWCGTIHMPFSGRELHEIPPNGQGIAACMALGILNEFDIDHLDPDNADALHLQIEAMKLAFADAAAFVADPDAMVKFSAQDLLDRAYVSSRARLIRMDRAQQFACGAPRHGGTVCLATGDENGMMVSFIQSNYIGFESGVVVPGTGISLQNRGYGFTLQEGHPNEVAGSKRPFHTIIPGFITKGGAPDMAFGLMGGPMQAQGHLQMALRTQVWEQDCQTAADAPRWRVVAGLDVAIERGFASETLSDLSDRGHVLVPQTPADAFGFGGAQLVCKIESGYVAGSDPRKDGQSAGY